MSYLDKSLMTGETVIYRARRHWILFFWPALLLMGALALLAWQVRAAAVVGAIGVVFGFVRWVAYVSTEFGVTNKRVLVKLGFIQRHTFETLLMKIEAVQIIQSIPARILNYGTVVIVGTGGSKEAFDQIGNPLEFRRNVLEQSAQ